MECSTFDHQAVGWNNRRMVESLAAAFWRVIMRAGPDLELQFVVVSWKHFDLGNLSGMTQASQLCSIL